MNPQSLVTQFLKDVCKTVMRKFLFSRPKSFQIRNVKRFATKLTFVHEITCHCSTFNLLNNVSMKDLIWRQPPKFCFLSNNADKLKMKKA